MEYISQKVAICSLWTVIYRKLHQLGFYPNVEANIYSMLMDNSNPFFKFF